MKQKIDIDVIKRIGMRRIPEIRGGYEETPKLRLKKAIEESLKRITRLSGGVNLQIIFSNRPIRNNIAENPLDLLQQESLLEEILEGSLVRLIQSDSSIIRYFVAVQCDGYLIGLTPDLAKSLLEDEKERILEDEKEGIAFEKWPFDEVFPISLGDCMRFVQE